MLAKYRTGNLRHGSTVTFNVDLSITVQFWPLEGSFRSKETVTVANDNFNRV